VAEGVPDVALDHLLVDNCAMQLILNPRRFVSCSREICLGRILNDEGRGAGRFHRQLPSASIAAEPSAFGWDYTNRYTFGARYRPTEQSQPAGAIGTVGAMLHTVFGLRKKPARWLGAEAVLASGKGYRGLRPSGAPATTNRGESGGAPRSAERVAYQPASATIWEESEDESSGAESE